MSFNVKKIILIFLFLCLLYLSSITLVLGDPGNNWTSFHVQHQIQPTKCFQKISNTYTNHSPIYISNNNSFTPQGFSGSGTSTDPYLLENYRITNNTEPNLIGIKNTNAYFIIRNNYIDGINKSPTGIYLYNVTNGFVEKNTFVNTWMGGWLSLDSYNNTITNNTFKNNKAGITASDSFNNTYTNNNIFSSTDYGISFRGISGNIISNNTIYDNGDYGIYIRDGIDNLVMNNSVMNNGGGIHILDGEENTIYNNSIIGNKGLLKKGKGLWIEHGFTSQIKFLLYASSNITSNTIMHNKGGLTINSWGGFKSAVVPNNVSKNIIIQNNDIGIYVDSSNYTITENDFIGNNLSSYYHRYDSQAHNRGYNNKFSKNYWDDWTCPDADADGIVDNPYPIADPGGYDASPLTAPHNDIPVDLHLLSRPRILYPKGEDLGAFEGYKGKITVKWCSVTDFSGHSVSYTLYYSTWEEVGADLIWEELATDLTTPEYEWDTTTVENDQRGYLKVVALCSEGLTSEHSSVDSFRIDNRKTAADADGWSSAIIALTLCLLVCVSRRKKRK